MRGGSKCGPYGGLVILLRSKAVGEDAAYKRERVGSGLAFCPS